VIHYIEGGVKGMAEPATETAHEPVGQDSSQIFIFVATLLNELKS
jgi:hypothetical protein